MQFLEKEEKNIHFESIKYTFEIWISSYIFNKWISHKKSKKIRDYTHFMVHCAFYKKMGTLRFYLLFINFFEKLFIKEIKKLKLNTLLKLRIISIKNGRKFWNVYFCQLAKNIIAFI